MFADDDAVDHGRPDPLSYKQKQRLGHAQLDNTLRTIWQHSCWSQGLGLADANTALKASYVLDLSTQEAERMCSEIFGWMGEVIPNPQHMPGMMRTCHERCGGLCSLAQGADKVSCLQHSCMFPS